MKRNFLAVNRYKEFKTPSIKVAEKENVLGLHAGDHVIMVNEDNEEATYIIKIETIVYKEETNLILFSYIDKLTGALPRIYWELYKCSENEKKFKKHVSKVN